MNTGLVSMLYRHAGSLFCALALFSLPGAMQAANYYAAQNGQAPERQDPLNAHSAAVGFAWSRDLETWEFT